MRLKEIAELLRTDSVFGNGEIDIKTISGISKACEGSIICVRDSSRLKEALNSKASALVVNTEIESEKPYIKIDDTEEAFIKLLDIFFPKPEVSYRLSPRANVDESAKISGRVRIEAGVYIGEGAEIAEGVVIEANSVIGRDCVIGANTHIYPNVTIYPSTTVGESVIIHSSAVIGSDGFGFTREESGRRKKIPQRGNVIIEDDVEIGAGTTIDRATLGSTIIRRGVKIDNLVQIAHNCEIGEDSVVVAQTGIAGSTKIGKRSLIAAQAGIADHATIGDDVILAARSGIMPGAKIEDKSILWGAPAQSLKDEKKSQIAYRKISALISYIEDKFDVKIKTHR